MARQKRCKSRLYNPKYSIKTYKKTPVGYEISILSKHIVYARYSHPFEFRVQTSPVLRRRLVVP